MAAIVVNIQLLAGYCTIIAS